MTNSTIERFPDSTLLALAPGYRFQWEEAQNCHVLMYPEGMVSLNDSSGEILKHVDGANSVADIISHLERQFPDADLGDDVRDFLAEAGNNGWVKPSTDDKANS